MTPAPFRWALRGSLDQVRHVHPVRPRHAIGTVADVYRASEREFGLLAPPIALHAAAPRLLAAAWVLLRETLLAAGETGRAVREAVALGVSLGNACPYCVTVHDALLGGVAGPAAGRGPELRAATDWARAGGAGPSPAGSDRAHAELLGVLYAFHYLNRMVHVYLGPSPLPPALPAAAAGAAGGLLGRVLAPTARRDRPAGESLWLLADAPGAAPGPARTTAAGADAGAADDWRWAAPAPVLARALRESAAVVEAAGSDVLSPRARTVVGAALRAEQQPRLGGDWTAPLVSSLPAPDRPGARLALLTALTPQRVDTAAVTGCQHDLADSGRPCGDAALLAVTAWASLAAARDRTRRIAGAAAAPWPAEGGFS